MPPRTALVLLLLSAGCYAGSGDTGPGTSDMSVGTGSSGQTVGGSTSSGMDGAPTTGAPDPTTGAPGTGATSTGEPTTAATTTADAVTSESATAGDATTTTETTGEPVFPPPELACEYGFFVERFEQANGPDLPVLRDEAFAAIAARTAELQACAPGVTLGGMLSLLVFEGAARVAMFNTKCSENSYDDSPTCWDTPKARYSYQFGLAPIHTSNFHPCADPNWTMKMRARLQAALDAAGFTPGADEIAAVGDALHTFCPDATPTAVDYYILGAHDVFAVPKDSAGNDLAHAGSFPFFTPAVMIDLFFATLLPACDQIGSDNDAIVIFGGGDASYKDPAKQAQILALWGDYAAAHCP